MAASCHSDILKTIGEKVNADKSVLSEWGIPICSEDNMFHVNLPAMSSRLPCTQLSVMISSHILHTDLI